MRNIDLGVALLSCAVLASVPAVAHETLDHKHAPADALSVTQAVRTGAGDNTYESVPNWCQIPGGKPSLGPTHGGIVYDKKGQIYFSMDGGPHGVLVYTPDGKFVRGIADGMTGIHGLCINEEGGEEFLYAAHLAGRRGVKLKLDGTVVWTIDFDKVNQSGKYQKKEQFSPTAIAVGPDGGVFIADGYGQNWIHQFDKDQKYVRSFGGPGAEPGKFNTCHGIAIDPRGDKPLLLVADRANRRLQHFDLDGKFVAVVTENLRLPCSLSFHGDRVAVAELEGRVTILDGQNKQVAHLGDNPKREQWANYNVPPAEWQVGVFTAPHGVSFDKDGNVYVMDWNSSGRVSKLKRVEADKKQAAAPAQGPAIAAR
jgi:DNA-binding beta-propeller fold protein YncE